MPVIDNDKEVIKILCIYYLIRFQKNQIKALLNNGSKINAMNPNFAQKLDLKVWKTNVGAQKIDNSALKTFEIVIADFQMRDKASRPRFFQKIFLVANSKFEGILRMPFLKISNADVLFDKKTLMWKIYIINKALSTAM